MVSISLFLKTNVKNQSTIHVQQTDK